MENTQAAIDYLVKTRDDFHKTTALTLERFIKTHSTDDAFELYCQMIERQLIPVYDKCYSSIPFDHLISGIDVSSPYDDFYIERRESACIVDIYRRLEEIIEDACVDVDLTEWKRGIMKDKITACTWDW